MKKMRRSLVILVFVMLLSACGATPTPKPAAPLRIGVNLWPGLYPAAIAKEKGIFAKHNVDIELIYYASYPDVYSDLVANKVDGISVIIGDILPISTQKNIQMIFPVDASDGADVLIVGPDIKSAADLKGKRIGVSFGTYGELFVQTLLKQNNIGITDVTLVNISPEAATTAFPSQVDVVHTYEPYASDVVKAGGHTLFTSHETPNLVLGMMTFPTSIINERPQDIQAFTNAWFEAVDWMNANPNDVPDVVAKGFGLKPEDIFIGGDKVFTLAEAKTIMKPGDDASSAYFITQSYIDFLSVSGILTIKPNLKNLINPSFLQ